LPHVPGDATPGERLWYRVRVLGRIGDGAAEGIGWFTGLAARPVEVEVRPADANPQPPGSRQELAVALRSHLPGRAVVTLTADSPALDLAPKVAEFSLDEGAEKTVKLGYTLPKEPAVAPLKLALVGRAYLGAQPGSQVRMAETRWLRFARAKATVVELARLTPAFVGMQFRGKPEEPLRAESGAIFRAAANTVGGVEKAGFFCHPPYQGGVGSAWGEFEVQLPDEPCAFETFLGFQDGSSTADGCLFSLDVKAGKDWGNVWQTQYAELKKWKLFRADLSKLRGQKVTLRLAADVGPADNSHSDWACWGEPRIVLGGDRLLPEVFDKEPVAPIGPPPIPLKGLKAADLRDIVEAKVILDGAGVDSGEYRSDVYLNDDFVGPTPGSASDTVWSEKQALAVPPEALQTIGPRNVVVIRNPRQDWMKVRRIHLWFRLRDGRVGTSVVVNGPFATPPEWPYAEGESVPLGEDLPSMDCEIPTVEAAPGGAL